MNLAPIPLHLIDPPSEDDRLDRTQEAIAALAADLQANGLINAVTLEDHGGRYECVAGWTRCLAARTIGWPTIPAHVHGHLADGQRDALRLAENLQRNDLTPIEEARRLHRMQEKTRLTIPTLAGIVHRSEAWVEQRLALLAIPEELQAHVHARTLGLGHALTLARCTDPAHRAHLTHYAMNAGATIATVRAWVDEWHSHQVQGLTGPAPLPPMPIANQPITVMIPCARCHTAHEYRSTCVVRVCQSCGRDIANEQAEPAPA
jgi:ParB family transcriptional regulator, chromosome partitioning protein